MSNIPSNVVVGKGCIIEGGVEIGRAGRYTKGTEKTLIGDNCLIRSGTVIYAGVKIGNNVQTGHSAIIREGNQIANDVSIGSFTELGLRNIIGAYTRIHTGCFLEDVVLGEGVFVGPHVVFANDPHPKSADQRCFKGATVHDAAIIGAGVTILPHIIIGKRAFVGAGSVLVKNVQDYDVVVGNPAQRIRSIFDIVCKRTNKPHKPYEKNSTR